MKYGLIGHPIGHSYSKIIHGLLSNYDYELVDVLSQELEDVVKTTEYEGFNVTLPHKESVMAYLDEVDFHALEIGAVNTIVRKDGRLIGYNTDYNGFRALVLRNCREEDLRGKRVLIIGTGGTSKTVAKVFADFGVKQIYKVSRTPESFDEISMKDARKVGAEIVVNTTPVGMYPNTEEHCIALEYRDDIYEAASLCLDVVYRPTETAFIKEAKKRGIVAEGGLYMLVGQAVYAARLFGNTDIAEEKIEEVFLKMQEYLQPSLHISVTEKLQGKVCVPPSKSYSHRHLILAAMAKGKSLLRHVGKSQDIDVTIQALEELGAKICVQEETQKERTLVIDGSCFLKQDKECMIYCRESGSSLRFLLPMVLKEGKRVTFFGEEGLMCRPMEVYEDICRRQNIFYEKNGDKIVVSGKLTSGVYEILGNISSQFVSGLLFVLPFLEGDSEIRLIPPIESLPYIRMTIEALRQWGIVVYMQDNLIRIPGGQQVVASEISVEKDYSNGAYLWAYNELGHEIELNGLDGNTLQGDKAFIDIFKRLKKEEHPQISVEDTPDVVPVAMAVAACFSGAVFTGTRRLAIKESNRGEAMAKELEKFGVRCEVADNKIEVFAEGIRAPKQALWGHNDHRIVMALSVLLAKFGGEIKGYEAVGKSYPTYFEEMASCGLTME